MVYSSTPSSLLLPNGGCFSKQCLKVRFWYYVFTNSSYSISMLILLVLRACFNFIKYISGLTDILGDGMKKGNINKIYNLF